ncbi:MAG: M20/M25/M40 family metallo-hydrolase [Planctomycetes bacterium]|nr:M20/M25/M40 family metallo-hydrolase [Planctomycetota bacterium]
MSSVVEEAAASAKALVPEALERLADYVAIPAVSSDPEQASAVRRMAALAEEDLRAAGLDAVEVIEIEGALPCVRAEKIVDPELPTVLIYGHFDQQPFEAELWESPPNELTRRGDRLYGRGSADDLGGWLSQVTAFRAWEAHGGCPLNVRFLLEGEEEIGSPNLERYMETFPDAFDADVMVLTDCDNPSSEVAGLTVSLRGLLEFDVKVSALAAKVHSGLWGGALPDVAVGLCKVISALVTERGRVVGLDGPDVSNSWRAQVSELSPSDDDLRRDAGLRDDVPGLDPGGRPRVEWLWRRPHLTVIATTLPTMGQAANVLLPDASARLSVRLAPGQSADEAFEHLEGLINEAVPFGLSCELTRNVSSEGWSYEAIGPAFDAAERAYRRAFGADLVRIGVGGSIPFITMFAERFPETPLILNGVMDPRTSAHGPNESLHVGLFEKVVLANVYLLQELAETLTKEAAKEAAAAEEDEAPSEEAPAEQAPAEQAPGEQASEEAPSAEAAPVEAAPEGASPQEAPEPAE